MIRKQRLPDIISGYVLDDENCSIFSVILPKEGRNEVHNPIPTNTNAFQDTNGAIISISNDESVYGATSLQIIGPPNGLVELDMGLRESGTYSASVYVKGTGEVELYLGNNFTGTRYSDVHRVRLNDTWQHLHVTGSINDIFGISVYLRLLEEGNVFANAWQFNSGQYETFIWGDKGDEYSWVGVPEQSDSIRSPYKYGGQIAPLTQYGFLLTEIQGLGIPEFDNVFNETATSLGSLFACSNVATRDWEITGRLCGKNYKDLVCSHRDLSNALVNFGSETGFIFQLYDDCCLPCTPRIFISGVYTDGLEMNHNNIISEEITIEFETGDVSFCLDKQNRADLELENASEPENFSAFVVKNADGTYQFEDTPDDLLLNFSYDANGVLYLVTRDTGGPTFTDRIYTYNGENFTLIGETDLIGLDGISQIQCCGNYMYFMGQFFGITAIAPATGTTGRSISRYNINTQTWEDIGDVNNSFGIPADITAVTCSETQYGGVDFASNDASFYQDGLGNVILNTPIANQRIFNWGIMGRGRIYAPSWTNSVLNDVSSVPTTRNIKALRWMNGKLYVGGGWEFGPGIGTLAWLDEDFLQDAFNDGDLTFVNNIEQLWDERNNTEGVVNTLEVFRGRMFFGGRFTSTFTFKNAGNDYELFGIGYINHLDTDVVELGSIGINSRDSDDEVEVLVNVNDSYLNVYGRLNAIGQLNNELLFPDLLVCGGATLTPNAALTNGVWGKPDVQLNTALGVDCRLNYTRNTKANTMQLEAIGFLGDDSEFVSMQFPVTTEFDICKGYVDIVPFLYLSGPLDINYIKHNGTGAKLIPTQPIGPGEELFINLQNPTTTLSVDSITSAFRLSEGQNIISVSINNVPTNDSQISLIWQPKSFTVGAICDNKDDCI